MMFLTNEQQQFRDQISLFTKNELSEKVLSTKISDECLFQELQKFAISNLAGILLPEHLSGEGGGITEAVIVLEYASMHFPLLALMVETHYSCAMIADALSGSPKTNRLLSELGDLKRIGSIALTEPQCGTDIASIKTIAKREGDQIAVSGNKCFVNNTSKQFPGLSIVFCTIENRISAILLTTPSRGFLISHRYTFSGWEGLPNNAIILDNCKTDESNILKEGISRKELEKLFDGPRLLVSSIAYGMGKASFREVLDYCKERCQFEKPLIGNQSIAFRLADIKSSIEALGAYLYKTSLLFDRDECTHGNVCSLKLISASELERIASGCLDLMGGYGYTRDSYSQNALSASKGLQLHWGTTNHMRAEISEESFGSQSYF